MDKKQAVIDDLHMQLRDASGELGEQRRRLDGLQAEMNEREARKRKASNLMRAYEEERSLRTIRVSQAQFPSLENRANTRENMILSLDIGFEVRLQIAEFAENF